MPDDETGIHPAAVWLRGESIGLRAVERSDAALAGVWYEGDASLTHKDAEALLIGDEMVPWGGNPVVRLMVVRLAAGDVVGCVVVRRDRGRTSRLELVLNGADKSERAEIEREVLGLAVPWIVGELGLMTVTIAVPADASSLVDAAVAAGMHEVVRLREAIARSSGRVDLLTFERVNERWGRSWREASDGRA